LGHFSSSFQSFSLSNVATRNTPRPERAAALQRAHARRACRAAVRAYQGGPTTPVRAPHPSGSVPCHAELPHALASTALPVNRRSSRRSLCQARRPRHGRRTHDINAGRTLAVKKGLPLPLVAWPSAESPRLPPWGTPGLEPPPASLSAPPPPWTSTPTYRTICCPAGDAVSPER
jgi:hypothetical protein